MKRLSKGFTLAEVLITLGLISVIASLTLPSLSSNITKQQTGPILAKAINSLEAANRLALQEKGVRSLDQISEKDYFMTSLKDYLQFDSSTNIKNKYRSYDGSATIAVPKTMHTTKDGITFVFDAKEPTSLGKDQLKKISTAYSGKYYPVYVDVNGKNKAPNIIGRDLFLLNVDTKGSVIPNGGSEWNSYSGKGVLWTGDACGNPKKTPNKPSSCAGSIADNGFKVIY